MRSITAGTALALVLISFAAVAYADIKIGFIDSERIFSGYRATNQAQAEFNADVEKWQQDVEGRALAKLALDRNGTAMFLDDLPSDEQPQAGAGGFGSKERLEEPLKVLRGNANPVILDRQPDVTA